MEQPKLIFQKNASEAKNQIVIPRTCIRKWGHKYYLEVYETYMKLIPIKKEK